MPKNMNASYESSGGRQPIKIRELEKALTKAQATIIELQNKLMECWMLGAGGIEIPENADLNADEYKIPGNYYCVENAIAATLVNSPTENAFTMKVSYATGTGYPRQDVYIYNGGHHWTRTLFSGGWNDWVRGYLSGEVDAKINTVSANLDNVIKRIPLLCTNNVCANIDIPETNGFMHCSSATTGKKPTTYGEVLNILESATYSQHQLYFTSGGQVYHRHRNNNGTANSATWKDWTQIV